MFSNRNTTLTNRYPGGSFAGGSGSATSGGQKGDASPLNGKNLNDKGVVLEVGREVILSKKDEVAKRQSLGI